MGYFSEPVYPFVLRGFSHRTPPHNFIRGTDTQSAYCHYFEHLFSKFENIFGQSAYFHWHFFANDPLGTYLAASTDWVEEFYAPINSLVIGVFFHISTVILFESSDGHSFNLRKIIVIALGILFAYFI